MDANTKKPNEQQTTLKWKTSEFRKKVVRRIADALIKKGCNSAWVQDVAGLNRRVERFEEKVNNAARCEAEYIAMVTSKIKAIYSLPEAADSKHTSAGKPVNTEWQEQMYQRVQRMNSTYLARLHEHYQDLNNKIKHVESCPPETKALYLGKYRNSKRVFSYIFALLEVSKSQITADFKDRLDQAEALIHQIFRNKIYSLHQGQNSADVQSRKQISSHSRISQTEISESKPPQVLRTKQISQQSNLQEQQVTKQSIIEDPANNVQQRLNGAQEAAEAHGISAKNPEISALPMIGNCSSPNEISHKPTLISDGPSPAMQRLVKVLGSMSSEALSSSVGEIRDMVYLNDRLLTSRFIDRFAKRKMSRSFDAMAFDTSRICANTCESFNWLTDDEKPDFGSSKSEAKRPRIEGDYAVLEEIKDINNLLIDSEVVIGEKDSIQSGEGLVVKFVFNAETVNLNGISPYVVDKKSLIEPIRLLVPTSYPFSSPVILDNLLLESSESLNDLSTKAKSKLRVSVQTMEEPWSLRDVAMSWDHCAREAIREYAEANGGGSFSTTYGVWEIVQDYY